MLLRQQEGREYKGWLTCRLHAVQAAAPECIILEHNVVFASING